MSYGLKAAERIAHKTVLITGASSGIGKATALELAHAANGKIRLILAARRVEKLDQLKRQLEKQYSGIAVLARKLDISEYKQVPNFVDTLPDEWTRVDVLINNAGMVRGRDQVGNLDIRDLEVIFHTNVLGLIELTNLFIPKFRAQGSGDIVMLGSIAGREPYPEGSMYCASKAALRSFTDVLRKETVNSGIRVMEVDPGAVQTEFSLVRFRGDTTAADNVYKGYTPLTGEDIAEVIVFALTRKPNTVIAETLVFPTSQAGSRDLHRRA